MWRFYSLTTCFAICVAAQPAGATDYNITYTDLTAPGGHGGALYYTSPEQQAGSADSYAAIWNGPSHTLVRLNPANADSAEVLAVANGQQAGYIYSSFLWASHAAIWNGSSSSFRDLNPSWSSSSMICGTTGTRQAGYATLPGYQVHAGIWSGSASSFVDLHPGGDAISSTAYAIAGNQQAGMANINGFAHAATWAGTAASFRDLNPPNALSSEIRATTGTQQAGHAESHAAIWFGTAGSFVDLNPAGLPFSEALATVDTAQAGFAVFATYRHAILWFGSADKFIDLQSALGANYRESEARSIWTDGSTFLVAGDATDWPGYSHPVLWQVTLVPEPGAAALLALGLMAWTLVGRASRACDAGYGGCPQPRRTGAPSSSATIVAAR
jgi:hypothetical protein